MAEPEKQDSLLRSYWIPWTEQLEECLGRGDLNTFEDLVTAKVTDYFSLGDPGEEGSSPSDSDAGEEE